VYNEVSGLPLIIDEIGFGEIAHDAVHSIAVAAEKISQLGGLTGEQLKQSSD